MFNRLSTLSRHVGLLGNLGKGLLEGERQRGLEGPSR